MTFADLADDAVIQDGLLPRRVTALGGVGSAVPLFSIAKRQHEGFPLGFVTTRLLEAAVIFFGGYELDSPWHAIVAAPIFIWELSTTAAGPIQMGPAVVRSIATEILTDPDRQPPG